MKIKTLEELQKLREDNQHKISLRDRGEGQEGVIEVVVGMGTCGISSGARETLNAFVEGITREKLDNVRVITVGCIGYCHSEPIVQVLAPGQEGVYYGKLTKDKVDEIIQKHLKEQQKVDHLILPVNIQRA